MRVAVSALLILLPLASCGGESPPPAEGEPSGNVAAAPLDIDTLPPDESAATPTNVILGNEIVAPVVFPNSAIPVAFHGRWGLTEVDCAANEPVRGLISISADAIRFFNSLATPSQVREVSPTVLRGNFDFVSEQGRRWSGPMVWAVAGRQLVRVDSDAESRQVYTRC